MNSLTTSQIKSYKKLIDDNSTNLGLVLGNYRNNVNLINIDIDGINFNNWDDDIATSFSEYTTSLKSGVVDKLSSSITQVGSVTKLNELIDDLYDKCKTYISNVESITEGNPNITISDDGICSVIDDTKYVEDVSEELTSLNNSLSSQRDVISGILSELEELRFDSEFTLGTTEMPEFEIPNFRVMEEVSHERIVINQYDMVVVTFKKSDDEEATTKAMYYLGTDSDGRSYFSESLDGDALVYRAVLPTSASTAQTYLNDTDKLGDPLLGSSYASARLGFVIFGGNTGNMTVRNILNYPNGAYTGDANFNTSLVYEDGAQAPEVVQKSNTSYDPYNAYHVVNTELGESVSLNSIYGSKTTSLYDHPTIKLERGEKITTKYGGVFGIDFTKDKWTIGSDSTETYLVWDSTKERYYVLSGENGYYTSTRYGDYGKGYRYVSIESLLAGDTDVTYH